MNRDDHDAQWRPDDRAAGAESPMLRLFALLERIAAHDRLFSLQSLCEDTGWPKPTVHRMLQQLEAGGLVRRDADARHYSTGVRLRRFAETLLVNNTFHGARHRVLRALVDEVGESCNITAFVGGEVVYLDRVETAAPLRFYLHPGSRVPAHCSASGKIFLSQMSAAQRARLLQAAPLDRFTPATLTDLGALEAELDAVSRDGHGLDREEFLPGLVCVAVPVPPSTPQGRSGLCVALQAPAVRLPIDRALQWLPALQRAAQALGRIESDALTEPPPSAAPPTPPTPPTPPPPAKARRKSR
ncbi:MAG: IclR family transcriptional regulator [Rubrivivax sp.]|nr:IclR family transcriptional regulator [Rubrivivax sp.]